ncbi:hypothetical protein B0H17DRAFT_1186276 [Mycena rosella]|uniref:Uncharacterized protein n=1 Tax=Mycena rosella TaxID=1033263 RepID=A0AAD7CMV7_MYCRO|nr:hypothetical protein B0H17DRAFT_1186276 [Mycena rosella]
MCFEETLVERVFRDPSGTRHLKLALQKTNTAQTVSAAPPTSFFSTPTISPFPPADSAPPLKTTHRKLAQQRLSATERGRRSDVADRPSMTPSLLQHHRPPPTTTPTFLRRRPPSFDNAHLPSTTPTFLRQRPPSFDNAHLPSTTPTFLRQRPPSFDNAHLPSTTPTFLRQRPPSFDNTHLPSTTPTFFDNTHLPSTTPTFLQQHPPSFDNAHLPSTTPTFLRRRPPSFDNAHLPSTTPSFDATTLPFEVTLHRRRPPSFDTTFLPSFDNALIPRHRPLASTPPSCLRRRRHTFKFKKLKTLSRRRQVQDLSGSLLKICKPSRPQDAQDLKIGFKTVGGAFTGRFKTSGGCSRQTMGGARSRPLRDPSLGDARPRGGAAAQDRGA